MASKDQDPIPPIPVPPVEAAPVVPPVAPEPVAAPEPLAVPEPAAVPTPVNEAPVVAAPPTYAPQAAYAGQPGYVPQPAGPPQGISIASMVCGIVGLLFTLFAFGFLPALAAVILGHIAQRKQPYAKPFWLTGIITGYVGVAISLVTGAIVVFAFLALIFSTSGMYFG